MPVPPRLPLALLPTPIGKLERLSRRLGVELYLQRDDLTGLLETGGEVRKLEFLAALNDSRGKVPYLTVSFVGDPADAAVVKTAAENAGGKYVAAK